MKTLQYQPGDLNYRIPNPFSNPFDKRRLAPQARLLEGSPRSSHADGLGYGLRYYNRVSVFEERRMRSRIRLNPKALRVVQWVEDAQGNDLRVQYLLKMLLTRIVDDCRRNAALFQEYALQLIHAAQREGLEFPHIEAFERIDNLETLLELLQNIAERQGAFQFELAGAAVQQYLRRYFSFAELD